MGHLNPPHQIQAVFPAHLDFISIGIPVELEVRKEDIEIEGIPVHPYQIQEHIVTVPVAVHHNGCALGLRRTGRRHRAGVQLESVFPGGPVVFQDIQRLQAVIPGDGTRHQGVCLETGALQVFQPVRVRRNPKTKHVVAGKEETQEKQHQGNAYAGKKFFHIRRYSLGRQRCPDHSRRYSSSRTCSRQRRFCRIQN